MQGRPRGDHDAGEHSQKHFRPLFYSMLSNIPKAYTFEKRDVFQWLGFAERDLSLEDVAGAAMYDPDENDSLHSDCRVLGSYEIYDICSDLITIDMTIELGTERI